ncbi:MAG: hypothetical protein HY699_21205 [Deltaproteobacteria bacterium]|nr:hypothetical protein [Deltaproteobacteria bacterium]
MLWIDMDLRARWDHVVLDEVPELDEQPACDGNDADAPLPSSTARELRPEPLC